MPRLPEPITPLLDIARNLWWTWHPEAIDLFVWLDRDLWRRTRHNPVKMLGMVRQERLDRAARDRSFIHQIEVVKSLLGEHMTRISWWDQNHVAENGEMLVAYFSAEYGMTEGFQIYSGGLGCLSGDHLKSAAELGIPLVAVGLLYRSGYFLQYLNQDGWQQETYLDVDVHNQPLHRVLRDDGEILTITVPLPGREVRCGIWECNVGRVRLFLLDTNLHENRVADRGITRNLYGGDVETRIQQEIVLGIGGIRALEALDLHPNVYHMNEGHSAFLAMERIRRLRERCDCSFDEAREACSAQHVFTTHTPVPAGIDRFGPDLMDKYFKDFVPSLGLDMEGLLALGRENVFDRHEFFSMAVLAVRTAAKCNGVSRLHGEVSRSMWRNIWPDVPEEEVPITHVTNGVHARSWIGKEMQQLFDRFLSSHWQYEPADHSVWEDVLNIPDEVLWRVHQRQREKLIAWAQRRVREQLEARGAGREEIDRSAAALDPEILTVGFARRFATYKRATLFMSDMERLHRLLDDEDRPVQFLIAGKAHPADGGGKEIIRQIVHFARESGHSNRVIFLENYDIGVARHLVTGCDVWLNTPRRGLEASGTSGMKAALNGVINCSILDGWWDEAYESNLGWAIGRGERYVDREYEDRVESEALYDLFEEQIIPEFYDRDKSGLPRRWITRMKHCIATLAPTFNTNRMVAEYTEKLYLPCYHRGTELVRDDYAGARRLNEQIGRYRDNWHRVKITSIDVPSKQPVAVRETVRVEAEVDLGDLSPDEVIVQLYSGELTSAGDLIGTATTDMTYADATDAGRHRFTAEFKPDRSGMCGLSIRVLPGDKNLATHFIPGLITWDQAEQTEATGEAHAQVEQPAGAGQG
ncbi:MAG: alpha-glucan family phosphorylase [Phycisphaerales bacterium]|nr:alpha-glucan family phosphorylase [Phycisphaerales bacterium]